MNLKTKLGEYGSKNWSVTVSKDETHVTAYSYRWWQFIATDSVGNVYFNDATYSASTGQHQGNARNILNRLGIKVSVRLHHTSRGFENGIQSALRGEIKELIDENKRLIAATRVKYSRKKKNVERREQALENAYRIKDLRRIIAENVDKKVIPVKRRVKTIRELVTFNWGDGTTEINREECKRLNTYKRRYFTKSNGKVNWQGLREFASKYTCTDAPESIDKIRAVLGMRSSDSIEFILAYRFTSDVERMIPDVDSKEYRQLASWLKMMNHPRNVLLLDKMHTYLTNKVNRREYVPSEPVKLPVHPKLLEITHPKLEVITTDRRLRKEGRSQNHCIGSSHYIEGCKSGQLQALHFKGYTFLLDAQLQLLETHGRFNQPTPESVKVELSRLIVGSVASE